MRTVSWADAKDTVGKDFMAASSSMFQEKSVSRNSNECSHCISSEQELARNSNECTHYVSNKQTRKNEGKVQETFTFIRKIAEKVRMQCVKESMFWYSV